MSGRAPITAGKFAEAMDPTWRIVTALVVLIHSGAAVMAQPAGSESESPSSEHHRSFAPAPADPAATTRVRALIDLSYPHQPFDLSLELSGGSGSLTRDQRFDITVQTDRPAVLLLLNVDKTGTVSVLYPIHQRELRQTAGLHETFEVTPPYGIEYLKLFAFSHPPEGLERWIGRRVDALDPDLDQLLRLLREPGTETAQADLKVVTVE